MVLDLRQTLFDFASAVSSMVVIKQPLLLGHVSGIILFLVVILYFVTIKL